MTRDTKNNDAARTIYACAEVRSLRVIMKAEAREQRSEMHALCMDLMSVTVVMHMAH